MLNLSLPSIAQQLYLNSKDIHNESQDRMCVCVQALLPSNVRKAPLLSERLFGPVAT